MPSLRRGPLPRVLQDARLHHHRAGWRRPRARREDVPTVQVPGVFVSVPALRRRLVLLLLFVPSFEF